MAELPLTRIAAVAALVAVLVAIAVTAVGGRTDGYVVQARFLDAGQLVKGNVVQVAGRRIGLVRDLRVTGDGRAEAELEIDDERFIPLHRGTRMSIRTVGLSGIANRFVDVVPGSARAPEIEDGGTLSTQETRGVVDIDVLFNAFGPATREDLRTMLVEGSKGLDGKGRALNRFLTHLNPAVAEGRALVEDLSRDQAAVDRLVRAGAVVSGALAGRRDDLAAGIDSSATTLEAIGSARTELQRALTRTPAVLRQGRGTLREVRRTLDLVRPALREARPVAPRLATTLRRFAPVAKAARPVVADLSALTAPLRRALTGLPALESAGVPALRSTATAVAAAQPIFEGLRPYALDILHGLIIGPGNAAGYYDANGSYLRVAGIGSLSGSAAGLLSRLPDGLSPPPLDHEQTGVTARCPGAAADPTRDGSSPFVPPGTSCRRERG